ncbi:hypothetical protein ACJX0J_042110, partial [Zea mays]
SFLFHCLIMTGFQIVFIGKLMNGSILLYLMHLLNIDEYVKCAYIVWDYVKCADIRKSQEMNEHKRSHYRLKTPQNMKVIFLEIAGKLIKELARVVLIVFNFYFYRFREV